MGTTRNFANGPDPRVLSQPRRMAELPDRLLVGGLSGGPDVVFFPLHDGSLAGTR